MPLIWVIALQIVAAVLASLLQKKPQPAKPASLNDFQIPQVDETTPQGVCFGDCWTQSWFVLWYGNLRTQGIKAPGGKK